MNCVYLQCDARFNQWLMKKIDNKCVVEYTINECQKIDGGGIVAGIYNCSENNELIEILRENGVDVRVTDEEDVNKRFLNIVTNEEADYVIRVGGDQCLIDANKISSIMEEMEKESKEWFFESYINCILPDIISINCLKKWKMELEVGERYFDILSRKKCIKRHILKYPILILFNFRANSNEGFRICKHIIMNQLNVYELSKKILPSIINSSYLKKTGLLGSWILSSEVEDFFYDENKDINPWWARSMIDLVKKHLNKSLSVFEWGCGNSTLFWSQYVKDVISIEHNKQWYRRMLNIVPDNVELRYCELEYGGEYCSQILHEESEFDIILVDGRDRVRCLKNATTKLKENGVLILDNSEREYYEEGDIFLKEHGFKKLEISSIIYGAPGVEDFTAIYYQTNNFLGL